MENGWKMTGSRATSEKSHQNPKRLERLQPSCASLEDGGTAFFNRLPAFNQSHPHQMKDGADIGAVVHHHTSSVPHGDGARICYTAGRRAWLPSNYSPLPHIRATSGMQ